MESKKQTYFVEGMHCAACELVIERKLAKLPGVTNVDAVLKDEKIYIDAICDMSVDEMNALISGDGYTIVTDKTHAKEVNYRELGLGFLIALAVMVGFFSLQQLGLINLANSDTVTLPFVFLIGVIASLSTCMAVVGGLVLSLSSSLSQKKSVLPMIAFHLARVVGFFVLGGVIGLLGTTLKLTPAIIFSMSIVLFFVMMIMGLNLLNIFPALKRFQLRMPKFAGKKVLGLQGRTDMLGAALLGIATFILPCGFTQSMQLYALSTGSFVQGALTMGVFALGTLPVLGLISFASAKFSKGLRSGLFYKTAGFLVIMFALFNFWSALVAIGVVGPVGF